MQLSNNFICLRLIPFYLKFCCAEPGERITEIDNCTDHYHCWRLDPGCCSAFGDVFNRARNHLLLGYGTLLDNCGRGSRRESTCLQALADLSKCLYPHHDDES